MLENSPWPQMSVSFTIATVVISVFQVCRTVSEVSVSKPASTFL